MEAVLEFLRTGGGLLPSFMSIVDLIDIALIGYVIYRIMLLLRGSRAIYVVIISVILLFLMWTSDIFNLRATRWVLSNISGYFFLGLIILFQPELRRGLTFLSENRFFERATPLESNLVDELVRSATLLANRQLGALIVLERNMDLTQYVSTLGQKVDGLVSKDMLMSIFITYSPLHDGAILIQHSRLSYAGCVLPLTERSDIASQYGTRHRAAIGITEQTDAVCIVVSEERGEISLTKGGKIIPNLDGTGLKDYLLSIFIVDGIRKNSGSFIGKLKASRKIL